MGLLHQKPVKEGWGLFCLVALAQLHPDGWNLTLISLVFFFLNQGRSDSFPLSIRNLRE